MTHPTIRSRAGRLRAGLAVACLAAAGLGPAVPTRAASDGGVAEERGTLPDGTVFLMRVPDSWNKTLIRDLDFAGGADNPRYQYLLQQGYALAGTRRHDLRIFQYDPAREIANLDAVLDLFQTRFGTPGRVIQYGCSGGGHVALAVAENFSDRVHGAIVMGAHTPVWLMNTFLDGWFVLKALIAPELPIVGLPPMQPYNPTGHGATGSLPAAWRQAIDAAQQTPAGRARIALAFTIGQWPAWVNHLTPQPDLEDVSALQHSMYHAAFQNAANPGGEARIMFESAANGQQLSWNTGLDYRELFEDGNPLFKRAVRQLYAEAGADLDADLARVNGFPRVSAAPHALRFWSAPGRTVRGAPRIPVFRMHEIGDYQVPVSLVQGYDAQIRAQGKDPLYRSAFVNGAGHCQFTVAEVAAAVTTLMRRLDRGEWDDTAPDRLNALSAELNTGSTSRFASIERFQQQKYHRVWLPE